MNVSYEGIGQWAATFACTDVSEGQVVKVSGSGTVADKNVATGKAVTLGTLALGDEVRFTDMDGIENHYTVSAIEVHDPTDVEAVEHSGHDLVLYTCTYGGKTRIVVFCDRSD